MFRGQIFKYLLISYNTYIIRLKFKPDFESSP